MSGHSPIQHSGRVPSAAIVKYWRQNVPITFLPKPHEQHMTSHVACDQLGGAGARGQQHTPAAGQPQGRRGHHHREEGQRAHQRQQAGGGRGGEGAVLLLQPGQRGQRGGGASAGPRHGHHDHQWQWSRGPQPLGSPGDGDVFTLRMLCPGAIQVSLLAPTLTSLAPRLTICNGCPIKFGTTLR